jgi:hypothetical protein
MCPMSQRNRVIRSTGYVTRLPGLNISATIYSHEDQEKIAKYLLSFFLLNGSGLHFWLVVNILKAHKKCLGGRGPRLERSLSCQCSF